MNVVLACEGMGWAGGMTLTRVLARGLLRAGHDVIVACDPRSELESRLSGDGVPTAAIPVGRGPLASFRALRRLVVERGADVLHVYGAKSHSAGLAVALTVPRLAFVVTRGRARRPGSDLASRLKFRAGRIDGYIAVSGAVRDALAAGGVSPDRVGVVPVGYDDEVIRPATPETRAAARAALGIPASAPVIGVLGNWAPEKGQAVFLEALARLAPARPALRAILAGWGTDGPEARAAIQRGGLEGMVLGLGYRADVPLLLCAMDVAVVPSLDEAAGIALVEAMAAGLPVAASDVGGIPEVLGGAGVRVAPGDAGALASAIAHLLDDRDAATRLGTAARQRAVQEFGGDALAARTVARYEMALAGRRKSNVNDRHHADHADPRRILVVQLRRIGDCLLCAPALRALKARFPKARLDFLVEAGPAGLLEGIPGPDRVLVYDRQAPLAEILKVRRERYDLVVDFLGNPRSALITALSGAPRRLGLALRGRASAYTIAVPPADIGSCYVAEFKVRLLARIGVPPPTGLDLSVTVRPDAQHEMDLWLRERRLDGVRPLVGVSPTSRRSARMWRPERFAAAADRLVRTGGAALIFAGPGEEAAAEAVARRMTGRHEIAACEGLPQLAALIGRCGVLLTNDNGPMHMAVALNVPTVTVYGPTRRENWHPGRPPHAAFQADIPCAGCGLQTVEQCPYDHKCMTLMTDDAVAKAAETALTGRS